MVLRTIDKERQNNPDEIRQHVRHQLEKMIRTVEPWGLGYNNCQDSGKL